MSDNPASSGDGEALRAAWTRVREALARARALRAGTATADARPGSAAPDSAREEAGAELWAYAEALWRMRLAAVVLPGVSGGAADVIHDRKVALGGAPAGNEPPHVVLLGATNTGKSTLVNLLLGRVAAGMDVRARFSQYPEAWRAAALGDAWLERPAERFAGYARYFDEAPPRADDAQLAAGGYLPALAVRDPARAERFFIEPTALPRAVLWDLPDFSTEEARAWMPAVLDILALADIAILTVTPESYADERVLELARLAAGGGAELWVIGNKAPAGGVLRDDLRAKLAEAAPAARLEFLPYVEAETPEARLRALLATPEAAALRSALGRAAADPDLPRRTLAGTLLFFEERFDALLDPLRAQAEVARLWRQRVDEATETQLLDRYWREYLDTEEYGEFRQTLLRVMEQMDIPGVSYLVRQVGEVFRTPLRLVRGWLLGGVRERRPLEQRMLQELVAAWLGALRQQAQQQARHSRLGDWPELARRLDSDAEMEPLRAGLAEGYEVYRRALREEIDRRAAEIVARIERSPRLKLTLRSLRLATNVAVTAIAVSSHGLDPSDALLVPLVSAATDWLWGLLGQYYVEDQRQRLRQHQFRLLRQLVRERLQGPMAALLPAAIEPEALAAFRRDFHAVREAAREQMG